MFRNNSHNTSHGLQTESWYRKLAAQAPVHPLLSPLLPFITPFGVRETIAIHDKCSHFAMRYCVRCNKI